MIAEYLKNITTTNLQSDAREESYYPHLSNFLLDYAEKTGKKHIQITTLPKKTEAGNPDFRVWDGKQQITGYIEAKRPGENLDVIQNKEQLKRYRSVFPNLILTDFYEFRLYRNGELIDKVFIGRSSIAIKIRTLPPVENEEKFTQLLEKFFSFSFPNVFSAESLAVELAKRTRFLRDEVIEKELEEEEAHKGQIFGFYQAFKQYLVASLSQKDFADIYSQTIAYGLFAARTRANGEFNRRNAYDLIPQTIGILRNVFQFISLGKLPQQMEVIIDDIAEVLQAADVNRILHEYSKKGRGKDPIVHFYETFLGIYDPETREKRGVYYTPEPVVSYIIRSVHSLLKSHFGLMDGLANQGVTLLDPAGGTLTFPAEAIRLAVTEFVDKYGDAGKRKFIQNHILANFYAFELMMAPYAIGHIKISFLLEELGYNMQENDRFKLYLTNTLDMEDLAQTQIPGLESLSEESHVAGKIKQHEPILVIVGNPPYSGHSANKSKWTEELLKKDVNGAQGYYTIDGKPLGEKNPKWLQDDYVKFIRFAQWKMQKAGKGIVGMITNHSYLDNPTFRGMRQSLMNSFNEIYITDLHGNSLKKETAPDGSKDENVFDIRQGTSIVLMVKQLNKTGCEVFHRDIFGLRESKYEKLENATFEKGDYQKLFPETPWYFYTPNKMKELEHYNDWWSVNEIFPVNSVGIATARDGLTIGYTGNEILNRVRLFAKMDIELARQTFNLGIDTRDWKINLAQKDLKNSHLSSENIVKIHYRPFDIRFTYYTGNSRGFHCMPRNEVMKHMLKENIALTLGRQGQVVGNESLWNLVFISENIIDLNLFYRGGEIICPLYLYPDEQPKRKGVQLMLLFEPEADYGFGKRKPNLNPKLIQELENKYNTKLNPDKGLTPENILYYVYAVLYSNQYRTKYAEFLKIDFPRIPFISDFQKFMKLAAIGKELADLHLLKHKSLEYPTTKYRTTSVINEDNDTIEKITYIPEQKALYINEFRYFDNIEPEDWEYQIGGYKVLYQYLKSRKGRQMEDPGHFCIIVEALKNTIKLQAHLSAFVVF